MHVLVFLTFGVSVKHWEQTGLLERELLLYKKIKQEYGVNFTFVSFGHEEDAELVKEFKVIPYYKYNKYHKNKIRTVLQSIKFSWNLNKYTEDPQLIKTNQLLGSWMAVAYKIKNRKPLIIRTGYDLYKFSIHENKSVFKRFLFLMLTQFSIFFSNVYIVTSVSDEKFIKNKYFFSKNKLLVLPNWVDQKRYGKTASMDIRFDNKLLAIGRLEKQKNFQQLIRLFSNTDYQIDIVGEGSEKKNLKKLSSDMNTKINFIGNLNHQDLLDRYQKYRVVISTSLYEGNPKSTLEAMGSGCLVIVGNIENNSEIISNNIDGLLHDYTNLTELVDKNIKNLEELEKFKIASSKRIDINNSIKIISKKEYLLYKSLIRAN